MRAVVVLLSVALLAGCGSATDGGSPPTSTSGTTSSVSTSSAASGIPEPSTFDPWKVTTDPDTGVSFALPGTAKEQTRPGNATTAAVRQYHVEVHEGFGMAVSFSESADADYSAAGLDRLADMVVGQLTSAGSDDVELTDRAATVVAGRPVLDYRLSFTAGTGDRNIWFVRVIGDGTRAIQLQSIAFVAPGDEAPALALVQKYHQQLVDSVRLP